MPDLQFETQLSRRKPSAAIHLASARPALERAEEADSSVHRTAQLAHDGRNLIAALELYCELLASPGVLAPGFEDYAGDLRRLAGSGAQLIQALASPQSNSGSRYPHRGHSLLLDGKIAGGVRTADQPTSASTLPPPRFSRKPFPCIEDLAAELAELEAPLRSLAGPGVRLEIESAPCAGALALSAEDLLRILFNLVANAVEALAATPAELRRRPFVRITVQRGGGASFASGVSSLCIPDCHMPQSGETVVLSVRDNGPGIAPDHLRRIFDAGFSTRHRADDDPHGLGLAIVRQLVTAAGGAVRAVSRAGQGARFDIELPVLPMPGSAPRPAKPLLRKNMPARQQISTQIEKEA